jgi:hypothetical protein
VYLEGGDCDDSSTLIGFASTESECLSLVSLSINELVSGDLILNEVMIDPEQVVDYRGEWFEVVNNSGSTVNLNGLEVSDGGTDSYTVSEDLYVEAGAYALFAARLDSSGNGGLTGIHHVYNSSLVKFYNYDSLELRNSGGVLDSLSWSTADFYAGRSLTVPGVP